MRTYGQCMSVFPEKPGELVGDDKGRMVLPVPDEYGGLFEDTRESSTMDWTFTDEEEWVITEPNDEQLV